MDLVDTIKSLIELKTEGDYWDFKEKWHSNKADLLHDIICMANNQVGKDAYIIIGVSDSKSPDGVKVKGVPEENRRDQQKLISFLRGKKFAGGLRPTIYLETIKIPDEKEVDQKVDVIVIPNSSKTPFFLLEKERDRDREVRAGYIYTRIGDTNTPIDSIADLDKIEYLWRKRFGIDLSITEKLSRLLDHPEDWLGDFNNGQAMYHKLFPEFQIRIRDIEDQKRFSDNLIMKNIAENQFDPSYTVSEAVISYHSTVLFRCKVLYLDGARLLIPFPQSDTVPSGRSLTRGASLTYVYFNTETILGKLFLCLSYSDNHWYGERWNKLPGVAFLVFHNETEKKRFDKFVLENLRSTQQEYEKALKEKGLTQGLCPDEYFADGWSKANEIKAWHLYEQYRGIGELSLADKLPEKSWLQEPPIH